MPALPIPLFPAFPEATYSKAKKLYSSGRGKRVRWVVGMGTALEALIFVLGPLQLSEQNLGHINCRLPRKSLKEHPHDDCPHVQTREVPIICGPQLLLRHKIFGYNCLISNRLCGIIGHIEVQSRTFFFIDNFSS